MCVHLNAEQDSAYDALVVGTTLRDPLKRAEVAMVRSLREPLLRVDREGVEPDERCEDGEGNRKPVSLRRVEPHGGRAHQRQRGDDVPVEHDGRQPSLVRERRVVSSITAARRGIDVCVLLLGSTLITIGINVASLAPPDVERREAGHECSPPLRSRLTSKEGQHPLPW